MTANPTPSIDLKTVDVTGMTPAQAWRRRRDCLIVWLAGAGVSRRYLADAFELTHSRVGEIVAAAAATGRGEIFLPGAPQGDRAQSRARTGRRSRA